MYRPPAFAEDDPAALTGFVRAHPFALLVLNGAEGPVAAHLPLAVVEADGAVVELVGHLARANPFWREAEGAPALAVFSGADAYVSPSAYPSKRGHGRVVPTWNYLRVEVRGRLRLEQDAAAMRPYLEAVTAMQEAARPAPWGLDDAPADYLDRMSHAVVGLRLEVGRIEGVFKLSQNKDAADRVGVITELSASPLPKDRAVAEAMAAAR